MHKRREEKKEKTGRNADRSRLREDARGDYSLRRLARDAERNPRNVTDVLLHAYAYERTHRYGVIVCARYTYTFVQNSSLFIRDHRRRRPNARSAAHPFLINAACRDHLLRTARQSARGA